MKKITLLLILNFQLLIFNSSAQSPNWLWAKSAGGTSGEVSWSCATDANGNVFATGSFQSATITFGSTTLTNAGLAGMYLVKYDSSGNVLWAKGAGGVSSDVGYCCVTDVNGNVFVTGSFQSSSIIFGTDTFTNAGSDDLFVVKYDPGGNVVWARGAGGASQDEGYGCATDATGNVFVTGFFDSDSITFGSTTLTNASADTDDVFIVKYDPSGNVLWAKSEGGSGYDFPGSCATDTSGNVFVTGSYTSSAITFGSTTLTIASADTDDVFIVKYDPGGNVLWAKSAGGADYDGGKGCSTDASGNILLVGYFDSPSVTFGSTTLTNTSAGTDDIFMVKYDANGNVLWAKSAGGSGHDFPGGCATDAGGNVFLTGSFWGSTITFGSTTLTNAGAATSDMFIMKYDPGGNVLWAANQSAGGTAIDHGRGCATDIDGNVFVSGWFGNTSITFGTITLTSVGSYDMYIAKVSTTGVGINENTFSETLDIFPNPATNELRIQSSEFRIEKVEIYNILGEKTFQSQISRLKSPSVAIGLPKAMQISVDVSQLSPGVYFVKVKGEKEERAAKFVKQ